MPTRDDPAALLQHLELRRPGRVRHVEQVPAREGRSASWPAWVEPSLLSALVGSGIAAPWQHQRAAMDLARSGEHVVLATGTASGKSLGYLVPVLTDLVDGAAGRGRIVQCSSVLGIAAMKYRGAYTASKFALEGLTDTLRMELRGTGVEVVSIRPGPIATRFVPNSMAMFHANIDIDGSPHAEVYRRRLARMARGGASRFKLPASAVVDRLIQALESPRPRATYRVTTATLLLDFARRILPDGAMSRLAGTISDRE